MVGVLAPTLAAHSARYEKTYRAAQRTYLLVIVSCRDVQLEVRDALQMRTLLRGRSVLGKGAGEEAGLRGASTFC